MNKVDLRAKPVPQPGPWRACCQGATWPETLAVLLPALGRAESALGVGSGVWGRGGLAPLVEEPGDPGGMKNTIYFLGLSKADGLMEWAGRACSAVAAPGREGPSSASQVLCPEPWGQTASPWV